MSIRTLIEVNHDYLHELVKPGETSDFFASLGGTTPRPPHSIRVLGQRHHSDPEFVGRVPAGWKLVPIEPTHEMKLALAKMREAERGTGTWFQNSRAWKAMLEAAPSAEYAQLDGK